MDPDIGAASVVSGFAAWLAHLEPLLSCFFIAAGGAERCAPNPAQLLGFREELDVDGNSDVSHVLEPANGLVYFLDDSPEF